MVYITKQDVSRRKLKSNSLEVIMKNFSSILAVFLILIIFSFLNAQVSTKTEIKNAFNIQMLQYVIGPNQLEGEAKTGFFGWVYNYNRGPKSLKFIDNISYVTTWKNEKDADADDDFQFWIVAQSDGVNATTQSGNSVSTLFFRSTEVSLPNEVIIKRRDVRVYQEETEIISIPRDASKEGFSFTELLEYRMYGEDDMGFQITKSKESNNYVFEITAIHGGSSSYVRIRATVVEWDRKVVTGFENTIILKTPEHIYNYMEKIDNLRIPLPDREYFFINEILAYYPNADDDMSWKLCFDEQSDQGQVNFQLACWNTTEKQAFVESGAIIVQFNNPPASPTLSQPNNNTFINDNKPLLNWQVPKDSNEDLLHFKIELATDSGFLNQIFGSPFESQVRIDGFNPTPPVPEGVGSCSYTLQYPLSGETFYWRVTAYDGIDYGESSNIYKFTIDTKPPEKPIDIMVNGTTHGVFQCGENNNKFIITWQNPSDASGIAYFLYKLGTEPTDDDDYDKRISINEAPLEVQATAEGGQKLYLWLEDGLTNHSYQNNSFVNLVYYRELPKVIIVEPGEDEEVGYKVPIKAKINLNMNKYRLDYRMNSEINWTYIREKDMALPEDSLLVDLWDIPNHIDSGEVCLKLIVWDETNYSVADSTNFRIMIDQPIAQIVAPENNSFLHDKVSVKGIASANKDFDSYSVYIIKYDPIKQEGDTTFLTSSKNSKMLIEELCELNTNRFEENEYKLCLNVKNTAGKEKNDIVTITIDNTRPFAKIDTSGPSIISCTVPIKIKAIEKNLKWLRFQCDEYDENNNRVKTIPIDTLFSLSDTTFIYFWDTMDLNGYYKFRLIVEDKAGQQNEKEERFYVINNPIYEKTEGLHKNQGEVSLDISPNGYHSSVICIDKISIDKCPCDSLMFTPTELIFEIQSNIKDSAFSKPTRLTIDYSNYIGDRQFDQIHENDLRIFNYKNVKWTLIGGNPEIDKKTVTTAIYEIGIYGLFGSRIPPGNTEKELNISCQPRVFSPKGNGFDPKTSISFDLGKPANVTIKIYNTASRLIRLLRENESRPDGSNVVEWDGRDDHRNICSTGLYIIALEAENKLATTTVVVMNK